MNSVSMSGDNLNGEGDTREENLLVQGETVHVDKHNDKVEDEGRENNIQDISSAGDLSSRHTQSMTAKRGVS